MDNASPASSKMTINRWNEDDRPREKLISKGARALTNAELLAILIGSGSQGESAVALMQRILRDNGNSLKRLGQRSPSELEKYHGMGPAKAVTILAACELGNRRAAERAEVKQMTNSLTIYNYFWQKMCDLDREECWAMYLNQNLRLISTECISRGGISETSVDIRCILKSALLCGASAIAMCHNHPSGSPQPGLADNQITAKLRDAAQLLNIRLVDHIVAAADGYYSYADEGKI